MKNFDEVYTLIIPVKPEKERPHGYNAGPKAGEIEIHQEHLKTNGGVFWSWGLSNLGLNKQIINHLPNLLKELGKFITIGTKNVKIDNIGYFYSTKDKSINWKFNATSIKKKNDIEDFEEKYIPKFRYNNHYKNINWNGDWILISELNKLETPFKGEKIKNYYTFPNFAYFSRQKNHFLNFNTNYLLQGNAFVIKN